MRGRPSAAHAALPALALALLAVPPLAAQTAAPTPPRVALGGVEATAGESSLVARLAGRSGKLRAVLVAGGQALDLPLMAAMAGSDGVRYRWAPLFGGRAAGLLGAPVAGGGDALSGLQLPAEPGVWRLEGERADGEPVAGAPFALITQIPFARKQGAYLNGYHIGRYAVEGSGRTDRYAPPAAFIEVTPANQELHISENFQLRQFLTKDQHAVWPKYVALDLRLIDKLELVLQELNAMGVRADRMHVMSGFRTPQYNGPGEGGRARLSRHTYGDAADVWVDSDGDGYIDDLNGDGRADLYDAQVMVRAVERVEARYPDLAGGAGVYNSNSAHGPFVHIDVRGTRVRW